MAIRLLKKDEIQKIKATEQAKEVAEGLKISRRVDSLRELQSNEELHLEVWRRESIAELLREIKLLDERKQDLIRETDALLRKNAFREQDLEAREENVRVLEGFVDQREKELNDKVYSVSLKEKDIILVLQEQSKSLLRAKNQENYADKLQAEARNDSLEAQTTLRNARKLEDEVKVVKEGLEKDISSRNIEFLQRENAILQRERANERLFKELSEEKIRLSDQRATLERAMQRVKNNKQA